MTDTNLYDIAFKYLYENGTSEGMESAFDAELSKSEGNKLFRFLNSSEFIKAETKEGDIIMSLNDKGIQMMEKHNGSYIAYREAENKKEGAPAEIARLREKLEDAKEDLEKLEKTISDLILQLAEVKKEKEIRVAGI